MEIIEEALTAPLNAGEIAHSIGIFQIVWLLV
jgi:hypothetical protein